MMRNKTMSRVFALLLSMVIALSMSVCAFAEEAQPYNADATDIRAYIYVADQEYSVFVTAPSNVSKINMTATLYQKNLLGYKEVDSMSASATGYSCNKSKSYAFQSGKNYKLEVTAEVYSGGVWDTVTATVTAP